MSDDASKPLLIAWLLSVSFGLTAHVWYGLGLIGYHDNSAGAALPAIAFLGAWLHLGYRCIQLPSNAKYQFKDGLRLLLGVTLPFVISSAITISVLSGADYIKMTVLFAMGSSLLLMIATAGLAWQWMSVLNRRKNDVEAIAEQ